MSGLEKMKAQILEEAEGSAREILSIAQKEADSLLAAKKVQAEKEAEEIEAAAKARSKENWERAVSAAEMKRRRTLLGAKQQLINEVLEEAYEKVTGLSDEAYFEMRERVLERYVLPEEGEICFSQKDLDRMPETFHTKAKEIAKGKGGSLTFAEKAEKIDGGFLLVYGGIEENCTIKALFDSKKEELSDQVNRVLFSKK